MGLNHHTESRTVKLDDDVSLDRFTELPDAIIHHIYSFFDKNEMFRTLTLSKRSAELFFSSPYFNFACSREEIHGKDFTNFVDRYISDNSRNRMYPNRIRDPERCNKSRCKSFKYFLDNYRSKHGDNEVHSFHLHWFAEDCACYADGRSLIDAWLRQLANCEVREMSLHVELTGGSRDLAVSDIPHLNRKEFSISGCEFLRVLEIDLHGEVFTLPLTVLSCLETLSLNTTNFDASRCSVGKWISKYCPSLKKLSLVSVPKKLAVVNDSLTDVTIVTKTFTFISVASDSLKVLSIYFPYHVNVEYTLYGDKVEDETSCVQVSAPKLRVLKWEGCLPKEIRFSRLESLTEATLDTCRPEKQCKDTLRPLENLLVRVCSAEVLRLDISAIEAMFVRYDVPERFENLHSLEITNCSGDTHKGCHIPLMAYFMSRMPKLMFLTIDCEKKDDDIYNWEAERAMPHLMKSTINTDQNCENLIDQCTVKEVEIRLSNDGNTSANGILLAIYFLESVVDLEKMTILYPLSVCNELPAVLAQAKIASSRVTILTMVTKGDYRVK